MLMEEAPLEEETPGVLDTIGSEWNIHVLEINAILICK